MKSIDLYHIIKSKNLSEPLVQFENQLNRIKTLIKNDDISTFQ